MKKILVAAAMLLVSSVAKAATNYQISIDQGAHHLGDVSVNFAKTGQSHIDAKFPAWRTGRYDILNLANGVRYFNATDAQGQALKWQKIDKSTWRIFLNEPTAVTLSYQVYANELGLRARHIDDTHAFIDASGFFMYSEATRNEPVTVQLEVPKGWRSVSGMNKGKNQHQFVAPNYDVLVDSPIETGINELHSFSVDNRDYELVIWGEGNYDSEQMVADLKTLVQTGHVVWDDYPYERYVFMVHATSGARGATEHLNSTIIQRHRDKFAKREDYLGFIATAAHEFIHTWNVKAYRPEGMVPYDYVAPNYTRLLWLAEGSTSYLEDHLLLRSGLMTKKEFFKDLGKRINTHLKTPGREVQSAAHTSFDKWINQGGDHGRNYSTNIYSEGSLLSMALDLKLLSDSNGQVSYRDVHRQLYNRHKLPKGFNEQDVIAILNELSGQDYSLWWAENVEAPMNLDFDALLTSVGLERVYPEDAKQIASLDVNTSTDKGLLKLDHVRRGGASWQAGLTAGDLIVAIDGRRISTDLATTLSAYSAGDKVSVSFFRRDRLQQVNLILGQDYDKDAKVQPVKAPTQQQQALFKAWMGVELGD
ncbi:M61 family metallopeptidase [Pseudoalteromonas sp. T1lg88]|uniref:M61 family metallopeptidase n=1 Tax=Pseudoalteromonas sp. T1lg88 TaxID=2077104 RepID=UPI000CF62671|nr:PDZ domain-containing protein [Pseudoalteromonas sp. T1lg88]